MGQVYRATDTTLGRQVAIKILPDAFASDPERLARFELEAKTLASLNHPHIAAIYGFEKSSGLHALVMELVEGDDLSQRIARGAIPIDEALPIARQIADALEAAHEQGIIHRDLKPANIKVRADGTVKVLDFGLAKAMDPAGASSANAMNSPTLSMHATQAGIILGTAAYMSPEQARGKAVDRRADIWAFGVVLFEMVTGRRAFEGDDIAITLAAVMMKEPDWRALPTPTPVAFRRLLTRCLKKDPKARIRDMGDARLQIEELLSGAQEDLGVPSVPVARSRFQRALPWASTGALAVALVLALWAPWQTASAPATLRLNAELGADVSLYGGLRGLYAALSLSPDGRVLVFVAQKPIGVSQLYMRRLDRFEAVPMPGTDGANSPFFSPDGQWVAFNAGGKLKKVSVTGGAAVEVGNAPAPAAGGAWSEDGTTITFSPLRSAGLVRVSSDGGGKPEPVTTLGEGQVTHRWPQMLPGGRGVLFTAHTRVSGFNDANLEVQPLPNGARKVVQRGAFYGRYLPSGHLVYVRDGTLYAAPFDLDRLELTRSPVPILEGVTTTSYGAAQFAVSDNGTLVYLRGRNGSTDVPIEWLDREGKVTPLRVMPADWSNLVFAPDGLRLALDITDGSRTDVWTYDLRRELLDRLALTPGDALKPVWTPDGKRIVYSSPRSDTGGANLYWQRADNTGDVQRLTESKNGQGAWSWHPNGKFLAFHELTAEGQDDVFILEMEGDEVSGWKPGKIRAFLKGPSAERAPMFSPKDGRWVAYQSTESGRDEVYVRPFPGPGGSFKISTDGGTTPTWSRTRSELFFAAPDGRIMVTPYTVEGEVFRAEKPRPWSETRFVVRPRSGPTRSFDLHPDGNRFALATETQTQTKQDKLAFFFNFFDELRRLVAVQK